MCEGRADTGYEEVDFGMRELCYEEREGVLMDFLEWEYFEEGRDFWG